MTEDETSPGEDASTHAPETPAPEAPAPGFDFSGVRGFQSLAPTVEDDSESYRTELGKELVARAERFVQSVDGSILLASDGVIRWLGDPVGRLVAGDEVLKPRAVLLADDALPAENREAVERRLALWVQAHIHKILGPLESLAAPEGAPAGVAEVAQKVIEALGVLSREDVRRQVKALDQNARSALRKLGVRFGANYIFLPALLKPGARALCLQLWGLRHGSEPDADKLIAYAAAGRTSFPVDGVLSPNAYRIAGFRLCGERVVRVDIVERLTDLIRASIPDLMRGGGGAAPEAAGFIITQQMTSLCGCAGEPFASILRSLGFENRQVKKSDYEATRRKPEPPKRQVSPETAAPEAREEAEAADGGEAVANDAESSSSPGSGEHEVAAVETYDAQAAEMEAAEEGLAEGAAEEAQSAGVPPAEAQADGSGSVEVPLAGAEAIDPASVEVRAAEAEAIEPDASGVPPLEAEAAEPASDPDAASAPADEATPASAGDEGEPLESGPAEPAAPPEEPLVEIWRPAPRPQQGGRRHHHHQQRSLPPEGTGRIVWRAREPAPPRPRPPQRDPEPAVASPAAPAEAPVAHEPPPRQEPSGDRGDRRGPPFKGPKREDRREDRAPGERPPRKEPRPPVVDPDSPFAKLAALRPLLERRDKRN